MSVTQYIGSSNSMLALNHCMPGPAKHQTSPPFHGLTNTHNPHNFPTKLLPLLSHLLTKYDRGGILVVAWEFYILNPIQFGLNGSDYGCCCG